MFLRFLDHGVWERLSAEYIKYTLIHRIRTRGDNEQVVQEKRKYSKEEEEKEEKSRKYRQV